ncbi:MAG: endonuclease/exonuclease/phosphatase family protein [Proteobacteria bacterium]|nr:endonuclease/exonuclease/phosphatase family protein [Pseudomonadota bacterium]
MQSIIPSDVSVMTINLRFGLADDGLNSWKYRQKCYPTLFESYHPDFIGVQEANDFQVDYLQEILGEYAYIGRREPATERWQHNVVYHKKSWNCLQAERIYLSETPTVESRFSGSKWPRQCVIGVFENNGRHIVHANTHFDFDSVVQVKSARLVLDTIKRLSSGYPVFVTGDFNSEPGSPSYREFTDENQDEGPFLESFAGQSVYTHHGFTGNRAGGHLDWILYRGGLTVLEKKIIDDKFNGLYPSDHFPVYSVLRFLPSA